VPANEDLSPGRTWRLGRTLLRLLAACFLVSLFGMVCLANVPMLAGW
jgi:hypothetical protein